MNLNTHFWQEFKLSDLFDIVAGIYHYPEEYDEGSTPYVSASNENNGVGQKINLLPDFKGNCIITGKVGCTAFYQPNDFCATSDVNIFIPKKFKLNEQIGLFIVSVINASENYKWSYGRQCRVGDSKEIIIKLPVCMNKNGYIKDNSCEFSNEGYIPDWAFMEDYIKSINHKPITTKNRGGCESPTLGTTNWQDYKLGQLFNKIYKADAHVKNDIDNFEYGNSNRLEFVTRTDSNNGCDCFVNKNDVCGIENGNAIIIGDTTSTIYYQANNFVAGDHIVVCRANWINKYTALFLKTILEKERYRYSYGRAFKMDLIKSTIVKLPTNDNQPDWTFMENYIKSLPYGDRI